MFSCRLSPALERGSFVYQGPLLATMQGNGNFRKIGHKASVWSHHGKRPTCLYVLRYLERQKLSRIQTEWFTTIQEAMKSMRRGHCV
jgi:hypothetical protein